MFVQQNSAFIRLALVIQLLVCNPDGDHDVDDYVEHPAPYLHGLGMLCDQIFQNIGVLLSVSLQSVFCIPLQMRIAKRTFLGTILFFYSSYYSVSLNRFFFNSGLKILAHSPVMLMAAKFFWNP